MIEPTHLLGMGGALGAICRYAVGELIEHDELPLATLFVNIVGSFLLGAVTVAGLSNRMLLLIGVGACGSFTTYSSFSFQTFRLYETGDKLLAGLYAIGTLLLCTGAAALAMFVVGKII